MGEHAAQFFRGQSIMYRARGLFEHANYAAEIAHQLDAHETPLVMGIGTMPKGDPCQ